MLSGPLMADFLFFGFQCTKVMKSHVLAHVWFHDFGTRHKMSIKAGRKHRDMRILCRIARARSAEQSVGIR